MTEVHTPNTHLINTYADFERLVSFADKVKSPYLSLDVETDSEIEKKAKLYGIGLCFTSTRAFYLQWRDKRGRECFTAEEQQKIAAWLVQICSTKKLIGHNILYDILVLCYNLNIDLTPYVYSDTQLLKHTLEEEPPFGLKELAVRDLGPGFDKAQQKLKESVTDNGGIWNGTKKEMYLADTEILAEYCMWDVILTLLLFEKYNAKLYEEGLDKLFYEDEVIPLYKNVTIPMKKRGLTVDVEYFNNLKAEIEDHLLKIEEEIMEEIKDEVKDFTEKLLNDEVQVKATGNFPKFLSRRLNIPLPLNKKGNITLAAAGIKQQLESTPEHKDFYLWLLKEGPLPLEPSFVEKLRVEYYIESKNNKLEEDEQPYKYIFNLSSNKHLAYYFFDVKKYEPLKLTETGQKSVNADFIEEIKDADGPAGKIIEFKKLQKLLSTYVVGILSRQLDGVIYTSMLQHGTTSGRYSSRNPNLQNSPRIKEEDSGLSPLVLKYTNAIRKGFVAPKGYKIVDADYSQLEPSCFAEMSGSEKLRDIFRKNKDLYSQVAIDVYKLDNEYSADKKAPNFLKKHKPEMRQLWKVPTLGIVYGMEESRLMASIGCDRKKATEIITGYLNTYPELKKYMQDCNWSAKKDGYVKTLFGRKRHLQEAASLFKQHGNALLNWKWAKQNNLLAERYKFKTLLNNAKNFPIQGLAAHIINRAMILIEQEFKKRNLDAYIALMIHDQVVCIAKEEIAEEVKDIMRDKMQNVVKLNIPLIAEPKIADNLAESH